MKFTPLSPKKSLNKAFLRQRPTRQEIDTFKQNLIRLLGKIDEIEREENQKNHLRDFLRDTYYKETNEVNTKGTIDLVVHLGRSNKDNVGVIAEAKRPSNKGEMFSIENPNSKALGEIILYYMEERITANNNELKNLLITNVYEWYIIDANYFDKYIYRNSKIKKLFELYKNDKKDTPFFYDEVSKIIPTIDVEIPCTYFDIRVYKKWLLNEDKTDDKNLIALLKILSPYHLLKTKFANDSNSLDKAFYTELLHIIGLTETKEGGKKLIQRKEKVQRNSGSLMESAIVQLDNLNKISRLEKPAQFGNNTDERLFNVALELSITWINRILFLKLLEAQLIKYHKGDKNYAFLNTDKVKNFDDLNTLFFQVLAKKTDERNDEVKQLFANVPYLNSSLFEPTEIEHACLFISQLKDGNIPVLSNSVIKDKSGKKRTGELLAIDYIFEFLNAYDFSSEGSEDIQEDNKQLINASVLGLIFEKINGYKDGSFFTPGFITMYMCRETIRRAVVQKFNETKGWNCKEFGELYENIDSGAEARSEANSIINSLKICDPAVGSGHFLVSALNEIIAIKSELRILSDRDSKRLKEYSVVVENDELIITDEDGSLIEYNPTSHESQRIQETFFHEKQTIIENCLFGVDLNPNSVKICRLRLWIELLKNAYYKNNTELETLPNIDINIKCGNSLISRFALDSDLKQALKNSKFSIVSYRSAVDLYRNADNKEQKWEMEKLIATIKSDFKSNIDNPFKKTISTSRAKVDNLATQINTKKQWGEKVDKKALAEFEKAVAKLKKLEDERDDIEANKIYENAFEWRFEFPEVLNDDGDFVGFDVVIGNPPYISNWDLQESDRSLVIYLENQFQPYLNGHWDLFGCFVILGNKISINRGLNSFILPTSFYKEKHSTELRLFFLEKVKIIELLDFQSLVVFEDVARQTGIYLVQKEMPQDNWIKIKSSITDIGQLAPQVFFSKLKNTAFKTSVLEKDIRIFEKLNENSILLGELVCVNTGVVAHSKKESNLKFTKDDVIHKEFKDGFKKYIIGSNLSPYTIYYQDDFIDYESKKDHFHRSKFPLLFESEKIIVRRISGKDNKIIACFDDNGYYSNDNLMHLVKWNNAILEFQKPEKKWSIIIDERYSTKYLTAILDSKLCTYFFSKFLSTDTLQGSYSSIYPEDIRQIPIRKISVEQEFEIVELVNKILELKSIDATADTTALESEIDKLVYQLYGLTEEEIKIVEGK